MSRPKNDNPFLEFIAGGGGIARKVNTKSITSTNNKRNDDNDDDDGWMSTKKRGRDDDRIAIDSMAAIQSRKIKFQKQNISTTNHDTCTSKNNFKKSKSKSKSTAKTSNKRKSGGKRYKQEDSDDDDSFIVNDDDESSLNDNDYDDDNDDDESNSFKSEDDSLSLQDDILSSDDSQSYSHSRSSSIHHHKNNHNLKSDENNKTYYKTIKTNTTDGNKLIKTNHHNANNTKQTSTKDLKTKTKIKSNIQTSSLDIKTLPTKMKRTIYLSSSSDENSDDEFNEAVALSLAMEQSLKEQTNSLKLTQPHSSLKSQCSSPLLSTSTSSSSPLQDIQDTPTTLQKQPGINNNSNKTNTNHRRRLQSMKHHPGKKPQIVQQIDLSLNDSDDDDENDFLDHTSSNQKNHPKSKQKSTKIQYINDDIDDESKDSQDEEDEEQDEYDAPTEEELEANSVLDSANHLSRQILHILHSWCGEQNNHSTSLKQQTEEKVQDSNNHDIVHGGAISLAKYTQRNSTHQRESDFNDEKKQDDITTTSFSNTMEYNDVSYWITKEEMQKICPKLVLKDYQLVGVNWLALLHRLKFGTTAANMDTTKLYRDSTQRNVNGVLADEMGLGKTVQTIAFLAWLKFRNVGCNRQDCGIQDSIEISDDEESNAIPDKHNKYVKNINKDSDRPHIIIVPATVLSNWERELNTFCPELRVIKYHGSQNEREIIKQQLRSNRRSSFDVLLTTFSYFSSEKSEDRSFLRKFDWNYMIVDEAHCLKNPKNARYKHMDMFSTRRRLLLTGTPVQNSPQELMALLCFLMPLFKRKFSFADDHNGNDGGARMLEHFVRLESKSSNSKGSADKKEDAYKKLKQLLAPFVLRRTKNDVLSQMMPPKVRKVEYVPFDDNGRDIYDSILSRHLKSPDQAESSSKVQSQRHLFTTLRKAANHPLLLRTRHISESEIDHLSKYLHAYGYFGDQCNVDMVKKELASYSDYDIHLAALSLLEENPLRGNELSRYTLQEDDLFCSPKFVRLKTMLPELISNGHRMLIFSQWTRILDLVELLMNVLGYRFLRIDGQTTVNDRQVLIDEFSNDSSIPIFLLSTRAGGMGINLTAADVCIIHDLDFNPFNDLQAEDRCHRIGQSKPVTVIKMVTENSVDADIYKMQERKAEMKALILEDDNSRKNKESEEMNDVLNLAIARFKVSH